uniref:BPTI/Kunitz inhibitor domain-containing protein n=1 Tax=Ornithorhynchus anatinus TaxID=9258 RepID=A0A6I8NV89_ORNAN
KRFTLTAFGAGQSERRAEEPGVGRALQLCPLPPADQCFLPPVEGPCQAKIPRFFYNAVTRRCTKFFYGGCKGNPNNFVKLDSCKAVCNRSININNNYDYGIC